MKIIIISLLLTIFTPLSLADEDIVMEMHFFSEHEEEQVLASETVSGNETDMHMVIFNAEEEQVSDPDSYVVGDKEFSFSYYLDTGYQNDSVNWSIAGSNGAPDTLTEVKWGNLSLVGFNVGFKVPLSYGFVFKGDGGYAWTVAGGSNETSYAQNGKVAPFSSVDNDSEKGYAWNGSFALGYGLDFGTKFQDPVALNVTPLVGYSWREQNLKSVNGREQISDFVRNDPAALREENSYSSSWSGPWVGADLTLSGFKHHQVFSSFQHHWADYEAEGDWRQSKNVQENKAFEHKADATGIVASAGYRYIRDDFWGVSLSVDYQKWDADSGTETLFTSSQPITSRLNEAERESFGINLGVNMQF